MKNLGWTNGLRLNPENWNWRVTESHGALLALNRAEDLLLRVASD